MSAASEPHTEKYLTVTATAFPNCSTPRDSSTEAAMPPAYEECAVLHRRSDEAAAGFVHGLSRRIDRRKLKTKMCQYLLRGLPCPFEGRCAFSHDLARLNTVPSKPSALSLTSTTASEPLSPLTETLSSPDARTTSAAGYRHTPYFPVFTATCTADAAPSEPASIASGEEEDGASGSGRSFTLNSLPTYATNNNNNNNNNNVGVSADALPTYAESVVVHGGYMKAPPQYARISRFRHNPYSFEGVDWVE